MTEEESNAKCDAIRQIAYDLHVYLGIGYLEKVYENGLAHRLSKASFNVQTQVPIKVCDEDGYLLGDYIVNMLVDGIVIELKAVSALQNVHIAQTINYLSAMKIDYGMLINFGSLKFESRNLARPRLPTSEPPALCGQPPPTPPASPALCGQPPPTPPASPALCGNHPLTPPASSALCGSNPPNPINRK
jgi:GxxExxY protein